MSASQTEAQVAAEDVELVGQIAAGDVGAPLAELYRRYSKRLFRFGMQELGNDWLAEEMVHESFVRMWRSAGRFDPERTSVGSYLFSIARSAVLDIRKRPSSFPLLPLDETYERLPFDDTEQVLDRLVVREALDTLSPTHRQVMWLVFDEGLTQSQIAERLGLPLGTVKSRMFHAMRALRAALEERGYGRGQDNPQSVSTERAASVNLVTDPGAPMAHSPDDLWTGDGYYFPPSESSESFGGSGEPPEGGGASRPPRPERDRYLVGELPGRVKAGKELSLIVSVTTKQPETGLAAAALPNLAPGPEGVQVTIVVLLDASLLTLGELQQTVVVPQRGDPPPLRFALRARAVGLSRVRVTSWSGGTFLAGLQLEVSVEAEESTADSQQRSTLVGALWADPGEVTLQVHSDGSRYTFQLLSQKYLFNPVMAESLTEEPGRAVERTVKMLRKMAADASGYTPELAARWVRETGIGLWQDLVPPAIQHQFWQLRDSITSFNIACDDDKVPWELLYPLTPSDDAGFLVEQFPVLRRVYNQCRSGQILLGDAQFIVPPGSPDDAQDEVAAIGQILGQAAGAAISDLGDLLNLLDAGSTGLLHFACHNTFSLDTGGSSIKMAGGAFVPALLNSAVGRRCLAARSPLIFINACRSAGVSAEYTQMMGWASQFMEAGAGAFVGTLWPVRSSRASLFAEAFYSALTAGASLGQASLTARQAAKDDADPTWLAYATYGDPTARSVSRL